MSSEGRLQGKKTLVTGSGTGIGRQIASEFARQGSDVVLHDAKNWEVDSAETTRKMVPAARPSQTVEVAKLAAFLCSDEATWMIGQTVVPDGGTTALMSLISDFRHELTDRFGKGCVLAT